MNLEAIDSVICEIMHQDGPDRHIDGHDVITAFIAALLADRGEDWAIEYASKLGNRERIPRFL